MAYKQILRASASILILGSVAACGDNNSRDPTVTIPTPTPTPPPSSDISFQSRFGSAFAAIFNRPWTEDPVDPQPGDVPPLAPSDDPKDNL
jgi:hypothetical protein